MPNLVEIRAGLGTQNAVMNFLHSGSHFATHVLSRVWPQETFFVGVDVLHKSTDFRWPTTNLTTLVAIGT